MVIHEEAGVIVTEVVLATDNFYDDSYDNNDKYLEEEMVVASHKETNVYGEGNYNNERGGDEDDDQDEEVDEDQQEFGSLFSVLAAFSDNSSSINSSSSSESSSDEDESEKYATSEHIEDAAAVDGNNWDDDLDLLEDIIYQTRLDESFYPFDNNDTAASNEEKTVALAPVSFDDDHYDP